MKLKDCRDSRPADWIGHRLLGLELFGRRTSSHFQTKAARLTDTRDVRTPNHVLVQPCLWRPRLRGYIRSFQGVRGARFLWPFFVVAGQSGAAAGDLSVKAWGFVNSDRFAGDLYVHRDSLLVPPGEC